MLDSIPQLRRNFTLKREPYGSFIAGMQETGYHEWGFIIYRTTYDDDDAFQRYIALLQQWTEQSLDRTGRKELLLQYHNFIIMDDKNLLDGATKVQVRKHFVAWIAEQKAAGVIPELALIEKTKIPRFNHCLVVDKACMHSLISHKLWTPGGEMPLAPKVACVIPDSNWKPPGKGPAVYPPVENCKQFYVGWMYFNAQVILGVYNDNSGPDYEDEGIQSYIRPPMLMGGQPGAEVLNVN